MNRKPIFLDRDGVINVDVNPYVTHVSKLEIFPYTADALRRLEKHGYDIYIVSNQQGVGRGLMSQENLNEITKAIDDHLAPYGVQIKHYYYATSLASENSVDRKPSPGMLYRAKEDYKIDMEGAFFIGDKETDMECAIRGACRPILVYSGVTAPGESKRWKFQPEAEFSSLPEAVEYVLQSTREFISGER